MSHRVAEIALYGLFGAGAGIYFAIKARDSEERKYAMLLAAGGVAMFAICFYFMENYPIPSQSPKVMTKTSCDVALNKLQEIRASLEPSSDVGSLIDAVDTSCANYLPWKGSFIQGTGSIDGISPSDMTSSVMWGFDPWNRFFVAMKHSCNQVQERVVAVFQSGAEGGDRNLISWGGQYISENCFPFAHGKALLAQAVNLIKKGALGNLILVD